MRNFLTTLLLSQGVPMLLAGDEFGRTQGGNNNAYCQDDEISWIDWNLSPEGESLLGFAQQLIRLRSDHIVFHRGRFFQGGTIPGTDVKDVTWLRADGEEMTEGDWADAEARMLCLLLSGEAGLMHLTERGEKETDDTFLLIVNAAHEQASQKLPATRDGAGWQTLIDSALDPRADPGLDAGNDQVRSGERFEAGQEIGLAARSSKLLIQRSAD
jgi:glycogen operon protein